MMKSFLIVLSMLVAALKGLSLPSSPADPPDSIVDSTLSIGLSAETFLRDAEFYLPYAKGYTVSGVRVAPVLRYRLNDKADFEGGVLLTAVAGSDGVYKAEPLLRLRYSPTQWLELTMGTIDGCRHHGLDEPLYSRERWYYAYKEDGLQLRTHTTHWWSDTWLDWEHFLQPWTADQERFVLATHHRLGLFSPLVDADEGSCRAELTAAFVGSHRGGQFSTLDTCIETLFNEQVGVVFRYNVSRFDISFSLPFYLYQKATPQPEAAVPFDKGWGIYPALDGVMHLTEQSQLDLRLGYWRAHQFIAARGGYHFQSVSRYDPSFAQLERHLMTASLDFAHRYKQLLLHLDAQFYYDLDHRSLDLAFGLSLSFDHLFRLF